jgi:acyl-CoA thioester hydrolase
MSHEEPVIFGDTDQMGVVYYANYLRFFEGARAAYWRSLGRNYKDLEAAQVALPVVEAHCTYKRPALYEDVLAIDIDVGELRMASIKFVYVVRRGGDVIAEGWTRHAVIGPNGKPRAMPEFMRMLVAR